jgi:hypothetical protein
MVTASKAESVRTAERPSIKLGGGDIEINPSIEGASSKATSPQSDEAQKISLKTVIETSNGHWGRADEVAEKETIELPNYTNGKSHKDPDLLISACVEGDFDKFDALQDKIVALRGSSHRLRQEVVAYRKEVQHRDREDLKYRYKTLGDSLVDLAQLAQLIDDTQLARNKLRPLEEEIERTELKIGMTKLHFAGPESEDLEAC